MLGWKGSRTIRYHQLESRENRLTIVDLNSKTESASSSDIQRLWENDEWQPTPNHGHYKVKFKGYNVVWNATNDFTRIQRTRTQMNR